MRFRRSVHYGLADRSDPDDEVDHPALRRPSQVSTVPTWDKYVVHRAHFDLERSDPS